MLRFSYLKDGGIWVWALQTDQIIESWFLYMNLTKCPLVFELWFFWRQKSASLIVSGWTCRNASIILWHIMVGSWEHHMIHLVHSLTHVHIFFLWKRVVISVQSSCFYDVWQRTKRWVSYRHLSSPAVTFGFNFYNENFLLSLSHAYTHSWVWNRQLFHLLIHLVLILMRNCLALAVTHGYLIL